MGDIPGDAASTCVELISVSSASSVRCWGRVPINTAIAGTPMSRNTISYSCPGPDGHLLGAIAGPEDVAWLEIITADLGDPEMLDPEMPDPEMPDPEMPDPEIAVPENAAFVGSENPASGEPEN
jgi:hypothetical protein